MARAYVGVGTLLGVLLMLAVFSGWTWGLFVLGLFMAWVWMPLALIPAARQLAERIRQTLTPETEIWLRRLWDVVHLPTTETLRHWPRKEAKAAEEDLWLALAVALITPLERFWLGPRDSVEAYRNWLWERLRENLAALGAEDLMPEEAVK